MTTNKAWKRALEHILGKRTPANDNQECRVAGPHQGPHVTVAADGEDSVCLCLHHAKVWSDSEMCHDFAATGHTNSLRVLSNWISSQQQPGVGLDRRV